MEFSAIPPADGRKGRAFIQMLRIMRITAVLLFAAFLQVSAGTKAQTVTYTAKSAPLQQIFDAIEKQTGYFFFYRTEDLAGTMPVTVALDKIPLQQALEKILSDQPLSFDIQSNTVVITRDGKVSSSDKIMSPPGSIRVKVVNETGEPLGGATVTIKSLNSASVTNEAGEFILHDVPNGKYKVEVSYVGYDKAETYIDVLDQQVRITVEMKLGVNSLDAPVIKGYYSTTKRLNTGNVSSVKGEDIQKQPVSDPMMALSGRVPGLFIQQASGIPGAYATIRIMGQNSIANGNNPLYVIDGVPFSSSSLTSTAIGGGAVGSPGQTPDINPNKGLSPFNALNPQDIESIDVLKDADATAIYGSRGANGVILITTKRGKSGDTKVDLNVFSGVGKVTRTMDLLNTRQYLEMRHEAYKNDGYAPGPTDYDVNGFWDTTRYTDWQKVLIGNAAHFTNAQLSISGGTASTQFSFGGGYSEQGTVYPGDYKDKKASAHVSVTHVSKDNKFRAQLTASYVRDNNNLPNIDLTSSIILAPDAPALYDMTGHLNWQINNNRGTWSNPLSNTFAHFKAVTNNLISNVNLSYEVLPGLQLKSSFGYTRDHLDQLNLRPATLVNAPPNNLPRNSSNNSAATDFETWIIEPQTNYEKKIGAGRLDVLIGTTFQQDVQNLQAISVTNFPSDDLMENPLNGTSVRIASKRYSMYHYNALFGRIGYNWKEKYLVNITARRDGSSRFGPGKQFGNFGAIGAGWIFSKENWLLNNLPVLSFGKIRASYGSTGNDQIPDYQYLSTYSSLSYSYQGATGLYPTNLTNRFYGWEVVKKMQIGLDLGFFRDRIIVSGNYYRNRDNNQLVGYTLPGITGFTAIVGNLPAVVQNSGLELTLSTANIRSQHFSWNSSFNITIPKNKLLAYPNLTTSSNAYRFVVGKSIYITKKFPFHGVNDTSGIYEYTDRKGVVTGFPSYPDDLTATPEITQQFYGGFQNSLSYKGFQLDVLFQFVKQTGLDITDLVTSPGRANQNVPTAYLARWQKRGDITRFGMFSTFGSADASYSFGSSDYSIKDISFVRLKNLSLSYTLPASYLQKMHLQNLRIYLMAQNLLTFTNYLGLDPETGGYTLPPLRMMTAGIQVTL